MPESVKLVSESLYFIIDETILSVFAAAAFYALAATTVLRRVKTHNEAEEVLRNASDRQNIRKNSVNSKAS